MTATATAPGNILKEVSTQRVQSIDLLRGIVMIIMALDHVRDYFHADAFLYNPLNLESTSVSLFFTRWVTHFCAPVFVFLAGTSAYLVGSRKGKTELTSFLFKRGVWLLVLEFTVINIAWFFNFEFSLIALTVIWALGIGMIALAGAIHLPFKVILALAIVMIAGHNVLDPIKLGTDTPGVLWALLHEYKGFQLQPFFLFVGYPVIPWIGIMLLGYCFGTLYLPSADASHRKKILLQTGIAMVVGFVILRLLNAYGDPFPWTVQKTPVFTFLSFINVTKYPPSLDYILVMLGPALIFLAVTENWRGKINQYVIALGRVPMFYYITHLYLIHIIAVVAALATGFEFSDMIFNTWVTDSPNLRGYGFNLGVTYLVWIAVVLALFPLCLWYDRYKLKNKHKWWLSYL
ncbi:MAG TPA: heparan-alpha-glucosaminide N-acetyltransferase domain-containing protein [Chryseosolibacter sp.]